MSVSDCADQVIVRTMTPLNDTVVLEMLPEAQQRASGLWLPEGRRVKYDLAKLARIRDVGPGVTEALSAGMEVLVAPMHDGVEITVPGTGHDGLTRFRIVQQRAVVAVLTPERPTPAIVADIQRLLQQLPAAGAYAFLCTAIENMNGKH